MVRDIRGAVSTRPTINLVETPRVVHLAVSGDDMFAVQASTSPTVFTFDDLAFAMRQSGEWAISGDAWRLAARREASSMILKLASEVFGPEATVAPVDLADGGAAPSRTTIEVRYPAPKSEQALLEAHERFMHRYVREIAVSVRASFSVIAVPLDADQAD